MPLDEGEFSLRLATPADIPRISPLIEASVRGLGPQAYSQSQIEQALGTWLGLDTQLVLDQTYFVAEVSESAILVACGGWSPRKTPFGSDHRPSRDDALLNPRTDAAKIRAFFVHPVWVRHGIASRILDLCEQAARAEGFSRAEMGATLTGVPFYRRHGYVEIGPMDLPLANGEVLRIMKMEKPL